MTEIQDRGPGYFCWPELATRDSGGAKRFYTGLFGWTAEDTPAGPGVTYTILRSRGLEVGALFEESEEAAHGAPPHWSTYVSVASADETTARVGELGGKVVAGPFDVMDAGRMAILEDPTGAVLCAWQAGKNIGARVVDETGSMCWCELYTRDPGKAGPFYAGLFGWKLKPSPGYTEFVRDGQPIGGMIEIAPGWGEMPPNWMTYFAVDDCDASAARAQDLGGKTHVGPKDVPNVGRFAVLGDPQGATFAIIRLADRLA